ncbi:hypothetical protein B0H14DRAFT_3002961 [Mycena olivaceomarginata]|nr:hypothetical protein B0H14DRAFT_3002961 [Mycena olivaceomarginata]
MSPREQVPYELWLEIFRSLPPDALEHLSLTCTKFKAISRPHLFNEFYFRPYKSAMERLEFWCSDEIAPHVRSCVIAPWHEGGSVWSRWDFAATSTPYRLGAFTGLQNFAATDIHSHNPEWPLSVFGSGTLLPPHAYRCYWEWGHLVLPLRRQQSHPFVSQCAYIATTAKFPTIPYIISILSKFSAVQNFSMICWGELRDVPDLRAEASSLLPVLRHYTGPSETMAFFVPRANLTHLTIQNCSPLDFIAQLQRIGDCKTSHPSLQASNTLALPWSAQFARFSPMLTALRITLSLWADSLALTCEVDYDAGPMNVPEFDELRDALVARYPRLTALWFDARQFLFHWRKLLDGSEVKYTTEHWNDAEDMRYNGFDAFWETQR